MRLIIDPVHVEHLARVLNETAAHKRGAEYVFIEPVGGGHLVVGLAGEGVVRRETAAFGSAR